MSELVRRADLFRLAETFRDDASFKESLERERLQASLKGGNTELALSSFTINKALAKASHVRSLPSEFSRILDRDQVVAQSMLLSTELPFVVPFHHEFHWLVALVTPHGVFCADSSATQTALHAVARMVNFINSCLGLALSLSVFPVPQQPANTLQCGIHLLINALALFSDELLPCRGVVDYDCLRPVLQSLLDGEITPSDLLAAARAVAFSARAPCFRPLTSTRCVKLLCTAPVGARVRFLVHGADGKWTFASTSVPDTIAKARALRPGLETLTIVAVAVEGSTVHQLLRQPSFSAPIAGGSAPLSSDEVKTILRAAKPGDSVSVVWSPAGTSAAPLSWRGELRKFSRGIWSAVFAVTSDKGHATEKDLFLPDATAMFFSVVLTPKPRPPTDSDEETSTPRPPKRKPTAKSPVAPAPLGVDAPLPASTSLAALPSPTSPSPVDIAYSQHFGTGIPEVDAYYSDIHLSKNVPLPERLTRHSGEQMTVNELLSIVAEPELKSRHPLYKHQLAETTLAAHRRALRWLSNNLPPSEATLAVAIPHVVSLMAGDRKWAPTTLLTHLNTIHGALSALFLHRSSQHTVLMAGCPQWKSAMATAHHLKNLHPPQQPQAMTKAEFKQAMELEPSPVVRAALEVAWLTAARGGDIRQILADDVKFPDPTVASPSVRPMTVTFRRGKTAKKEQYTIGAPLPSAPTLEHLHQRKVQGSWAFPGVTGKMIQSALRRANPSLEQRSIRRGYLQYLSKDCGWTDSQLLEVSKHASVQMLRRYLDMGVVSSTTHATAALAAKGSASL